MTTPASIAVQGIGYGTLAVATQGFYGIPAQYLAPGSVLQTLSFGLPTVTVDPTQYIYPPSALQVQRGGVHVVSGGNVVSRWLWRTLWVPVWTYIDRNVWHDDES